MNQTLGSLVRTLTKPPKALYHGSAYKATELKPGFQHSGKLVVWDQIESNKYLYASDDKRAAELLGLSSALEKAYKLDHTNINDAEKSISLTFTPGSKIPTIRDINNTTVYVYTIPYSPVWIPNNNPHNDIIGEYRTEATIEDIEKTEVLNLKELLKDYRVTIN